MRWPTETLGGRPRFAVAIAASLFAAIFSIVWVFIEDVPVSALGYVNRAVVFAFVAVLVRRFATQLRRAEAESARHFELSLDMISTAGARSTGSSGPRCRSPRRT